MDWNNDGELDILSGCYWTRRADAAHLQLLIGQGGNNFSKSQGIKSSAGKPLLNVPHKTNVPKGQRKYDWQNICIHQFAADIDDDGDLDLLVGNIRKSLILHKNEGQADAPGFSDHGEVIATLPHSKTSPHLFDWDGDSDLDLLFGCGSGAVYLSINEGDAKSPKWESFDEIIGSTTTKSTMSKLHVTDWNNDNRPDILVGTRDGRVQVFLQKGS